MEQTSVDEKQRYLNVREQEFQTTLRVLKAFPQDKGDFKPHERSMSARELVFLFAGEETVLPQLLEGTGFPTGERPAPPADLKDIIVQYETAHRALDEHVKKMSADDLNVKVKFPVAPKKMGDVRRMDILWMFLMDQVHHRGQLSVYLRMAGGKVPSIYGPSADEPWT